MTAAAEPPAVAIGVRQLAANVHRRGDIHYRYESAATAAEGIAAQRRAQRERPESHQREVPVAATVHEHGIALTVRGRIDGMDRTEGVIEEFKTTRADIDGLHEHLGGLHWAQLKLYAALAGREVDAPPHWRLKLTYLQPDDPAQRCWEERAAAGDLAQWFLDTTRAYAAELARSARRVAHRNAALRALAFPYPHFRAGQRRLAKAVFRTLRDAGQLLAEAPTGSGKSVATLFGALQAMGHGHLDRIIFATARTTGQRAAADALAACGLGKALAVVTVTAKRRICFNPDLPCDPQLCRYAKGYYDRMPAARAELLAAGCMDRAAVEAAARRHVVCPFELSVDAAAWADVVICDYNYVFDPVVRLARLIGAPFRRVGLLVDEAHQLGERNREMLSVSLRGAALQRAHADAPPPLREPLAAVGRTLFKLRRGGGGPMAPPKALLRAVEALGAVRGDLDLGLRPELRDLLFDCHRFARGSAWFDAEDYGYLLNVEAEEVEARMACLSPARHIGATLATFHGAVRFTGTASPIDLFQRLHGQADAGRAMRLDGGLPTEALAVFIVPDITTRYRRRAATLPALAGLIAAVTEATPGPYLVALPSFEYLEAVAGHLVELASCAIEVQGRGMSQAEQGDFIGRLSSAGEPRIGLVTLGGSFAESVDFGGGALQGVIVAGPGLAPPSAERDLIARRFGHGGFDAAYRLPAMTKVVQAAGRAVRGPADHGVVVLVDPRFTQAGYRAYFPSHWRPSITPSQRLDAAVAAFWRGAS